LTVVAVTAGEVTGIFQLTLSPWLSIAREGFAGASGFAGVGTPDNGTGSICRVVAATVAA
jgi:hypothetical protein